MSIKRNTAEKWMGPRDRLVDSECEMPAAAHVVTPRWGYTHHGIYVGAGKVVHYGGFIRGLRRVPIEEVPLAEFAQGRPIAYRAAESFWFDSDEVVRRARLRLGEDRYDVLSNNCEHFCEWCVRDEHRSYQVDTCVARFFRCVFRLQSASSLNSLNLGPIKNNQSDPPAFTFIEKDSVVDQYQSVRDTNVQSRHQPAAGTLRTHFDT